MKKLENNITSIDTMAILIKNQNSNSLGSESTGCHDAILCFLLW